VPVLLVPLVGYGFLFVSPIGGTGDSMRSLVAGLMTVGGLGLLTLRLSAQGGALQRADERLRLLAAAIEQTGDAIVITRANGTIEHANDAFLRAVGYSREELGLLTPSDLTQTPFEMTSGHILREGASTGCGALVLAAPRRRGLHASTVVASETHPAASRTRWRRARHHG
jgi:PAS domain-containing protein